MHISSIGSLWCKTSAFHNDLHLRVGAVVGESFEQRFHNARGNNIRADGAATRQRVHCRGDLRLDLRRIKAMVKASRVHTMY